VTKNYLAYTWLPNLTSGDDGAFRDDLSDERHTGTILREGDFPTFAEADGGDDLVVEHDGGRPNVFLRAEGHRVFENSVVGHLVDFRTQNDR